MEIYSGTSENDLKVLKRGIVKDVSCADYDFGKAYADTDVKQGKSYYYKVRAYAMMNGKEVYGDWSPVIRIRAASRMVYIRCGLSESRTAIATMLSLR